MKYESPITSGKKVMAKVRVLFTHHTRTPTLTPTVGL